MGALPIIWPPLGGRGSYHGHGDDSKPCCRQPRPLPLGRSVAWLWSRIGQAKLKLWLRGRLSSPWLSLKYGAAPRGQGIRRAAGRAAPANRASGGCRFEGEPSKGHRCVALNRSTEIVWVCVPAEIEWLCLPDTRGKGIWGVRPRVGGGGPAFQGASDIAPGAETVSVEDRAESEFAAAGASLYTCLWTQALIGRQAPKRHAVHIRHRRIRSSGGQWMMGWAAACITRPPMTLSSRHGFNLDIVRPAGARLSGWSRTRLLPRVELTWRSGRFDGRCHRPGLQRTAWEAGHLDGQLTPPALSPSLNRENAARVPAQMMSLG